jgi:phage replication-related protein YjqB (UPF0714/DUF867 family)
VDKEEDELMSDELAGCMSDLEQNNQKEENKGEEQSFKQLSPKKMQLNPGVLKEKELEEARAVFAKHGFEVPEPVAKNSKSRTSSEMLFGENGSSSSKNRDIKAASKRN